MKTTLAILTASFVVAVVLLNSSSPTARPLSKEPPVARETNGKDHAAVRSVPAVAKSRAAAIVERNLTTEVTPTEDGVENEASLVEEPTLVGSMPKPMLDRIVETVDLKQQQQLILSLIEERFEYPGEVEVAWIEQLPGRSLQKFATENLARKWGERDLDAAWGWLEQIGDPNLQAAAMSGVVWNLALQDFESTAEWISQLEPSKLRDAAALKAAKILAITQPRRAVSWASEFPAGTLQDDALTYGLHQWTAVDLDSAAGWAIELKDESLQTKTLPIIAAAWANTDPQAATEWADQFPDGIREKALELTNQRRLARNSDSVTQSAPN